MTINILKICPYVIDPNFNNFSMSFLFDSVYGGNLTFIGYGLTAFVLQILFGLLNPIKPDYPWNLPYPLLPTPPKGS